MKNSRGTLASLLFVGIVALGWAAAAQAQSGNFTVSQNGHSVGTATYRFASQAGGVDSTSVVRVSMKGLNYSLSKNDQLDQADRLQHVQLSATINNSAVNVTGRPDGAQFLLNISANGRSTTTRLTAHADAVFLPDFDPGALQMLLTLGVTKNHHDLWAVIPKEAGSVKSVQLATYPDEHGTLNGQPVTVHHVVATIGNTQTHLFTSASNELLQAELPQEGFALVQGGFKLTPPKKPMAAPPAQ